MDKDDPKDPREAPAAERDRPGKQDPRQPEPNTADKSSDDDGDFRYTDWASI